MQTVSTRDVSTRDKGADIQITSFGLVQLGAIAALVLAINSPYQAYAQSAYNTDAVSIDLSVLDDNGTGIGTNDLTINRSGGIKKPPFIAPTSRLLVRPKSPVSNLNQQDLKIKVPPLETGKTAKPKHIDADMPKAKMAKAPAVEKMDNAASVETVMAPAPPSLPKMTTVPNAPIITESTAKPKEPKPAETMPAPAVMPKVAEQIESPTVPVVSEAPKELIVSAAPPLPPVTKKAPEPEPAVITTTAKIEPKQSTLPEGQVLSVVFKAKSGRLSSAAKKDLMEVAKKYENNKTVRLQLKAYAGGKDLSVIKAKRLSLTRALAVRSYMIGRGMRGARIDVRALGNQTTDTPYDRVDVNVIKK